MAPDARFARLQTDPRFRRAKQKNLKAEIDDRFKDVLSEDFGAVKGKARVDKRGRPLASSSTQDSMKRFYRLASPEGGEGEEKQHIDYARGEGALESSGSEDEESEVEEEELELGGKKKYRYVPSDSEEEEEEEDEEDDEESADEGQLRVNLSEDDVELEEAEEEEEGVDPTTRLAAVNLDWDHLRASDLFTIFNSFIKAPQSVKDAAPSKPAGKLLSVRIYPSEFGKERMAQEDEAGPGGGIFKTAVVSKSKSKAQRIREEEVESEGDDESGSDAEEEDDDEAMDEDDDEATDVEGQPEEEDADSLSDDGLDIERDDLELVSDVESEVSDAGSDDIDMTKLRQYQLERLRYYYAIATFSTVEAAQVAYQELDGTEFERTANIMDLSFVPEGMEFDEDTVHDECTKESKAYKGNDFVTDALRHSKVKLTWDQDDPNRVKMTRRALTREEIDEEDFNGLVAASSDDSEPEAEETEVAEKKKTKKEKMKERKDKLRALLLADDENGDIWGKAGASWQNELADIREDAAGKKGTKEKDSKGKEEVEITFKPGLTLKTDDDDLTTLDKYRLRMKEKKQKKKEARELRAAEKNDGDKGDDFFGDSESEEEVKEVKGKKGKSKGDKESKPKTKPDSDAGDIDADELGLVQDPTHHFDLKDAMMVAKDEKSKRKRKRKGKAAKEPELGPEGFSVDVADPRFKAMYDEAAFAVDPTHPKFADLPANREILKRTREGHAASRGEGRKTDAPQEKELGDLVASVKRKMEGSAGKRKRSRK